jgi:small subunit ribosomal protein S6
MATEKKKTYEGMFLLPPTAATELDNTLASVRTMIERHGGEVLVLKKWDERKLAYEIKKQKRGLYVLAYFTAPGAAVGQIERDVNLSETFLRVLITHADHLTRAEMEAVEPQPIQVERERTEERFDRGGDRPDRGDRFERRPPRRREDEAAPSNA